MKLSYTEISGNKPGIIEFSNGVIMEFGTYPMNSLASDGDSGGYKVNITLNKIKTFYCAYATSIYANGFPKCAIKNRQSGIITLISDVNVNGGFISWLVIGKI